MKVKNQVIFHVIIWLSLYIIPVIRYTFFVHTDRFHSQDYLQLLFQSALVIFNFYFFYFVIFKRIFNPKKLPATIFWLLAYFSIMIAFRYGVTRAYYELFDVKFFVKKYRTFWFNASHTILYTLIAAVTKLSIDWFYSQNIQKELLLQKQQSELHILRAQVNPHFLFNTLNNIYSLAQKKSDHAPEAILRLSEMMRYTTKEVHSNFVPLENEVSFIESYIKLQKLRIANPDLIQLTINGSIKDKEIAPLLLMPFVENAFKHGKNISINGITMDLNITSENLIFIVKNKYGQANKLPKSGTGLLNVKKRLDILYKDKYTLDTNIDEKEQVYISKLKLIF